MLKISAPSTKKGLSSEKKSGKRWLTSICGRFDSIWEKSGLIVKSAVRSEVTPYFTFTPASGSVAWLAKPGTVGSISPNWIAVKVGRISRFRLVVRSVIPSSTPIWLKKAGLVSRHRSPDLILPVLALYFANDLESPPMGFPLRWRGIA